MKRLTIMFSLLFLLNGCIFQFPFYKDKDLIDVPDLTGEWVAADKNSGNDSTSWTLLKTNEKEYVLTFREGNVKPGLFGFNTFNAKFFKLDGQLYIDLQITDSLYGDLGGHNIGKIYVNNDLTIQIIFIDIDNLLALIKTNKIQLSYISEAQFGDYSAGISYTISEQTDNLQKFVVKYSNDQNIFDDSKPIKLKRKIK